MAEKKVDKQRVITPLARVSFAQVFKPKAFEDQEPKYSCDLIFSAKADLSALRKAVFAAKVKEWGPDKTKWPKKLKSPFKDGSEKEDIEGYKGMVYITATNKHKPGVVDGNLDPISEEDDLFYSGCYAYASLRAGAYNMKVNKGVAFYLENIQKAKDGERFSGRQKAEDAFERIEESDQEESEEDESDEDGGF